MLNSSQIVITSVLGLAAGLVACGSTADEGADAAGVADAIAAADAGVPRADAGPADAPPQCLSTPMNATLTAHLRITADNECEVYLNGALVGATTSWTSPVTFDVALYLHPGRKNVLAVKGTNTSSQTGNDRGIIGELTIDGASGPEALVVTDGEWKAARDAGEDWMAIDLDDSAWTPAVEIAAHGDAPWGPVMTTSAASWIWHAMVPVDTAEKPNLETTYARRTFYFSLDGTRIESGPSCP